MDLTPESFEILKELNSKSHLPQRALEAFKREMTLASKTPLTFEWTFSPDLDAHDSWEVQIYPPEREKTPLLAWDSAEWILAGDMDSNDIEAAIHVAQALISFTGTPMDWSSLVEKNVTGILGGLLQHMIDIAATGPIPRDKEKHRFTTHQPAPDR